MESFKIQNLSFVYPKRKTKALDNINLTIKSGEFVTVCGESGCGKTTLLRLLKPSVAPCGNITGSICFENTCLSDIDLRTVTEKIGFVMQNPENTAVTDKVWHELAFGLESLGYPTSEIRTRVSEAALFFGIDGWFHKSVSELSGGQKQLLNLASVMAMQPSVLILDEPTSQLDPIAASEFLKALYSLNRELGTTVILSEHRLEEILPISDRVIVMEKGTITAEGVPTDVINDLKLQNSDMYWAFPSPMQIYGAVEEGTEYPLTVRDGRIWLEDYACKNCVNPDLIPGDESESFDSQPAIEVKDVWFRYKKELRDVIKGLNLTVNHAELYAIVGGNGSGKTTTLSVISGVCDPYRGKVLINGHKLSDIDGLYDGVIGVLVQNPQDMFLKKTVYLDLQAVLTSKNIFGADAENKIKSVASLCRIENLLNSHPYDLSGGEQQRAALAKVLLSAPEIVLMDEPTKGMDVNFKKIFADILRDLKSSGVTVVMVSHDIEFCARHADRCVMLFDGNVTSSGTPREFFKGKSFYTTSANRMARGVLPNAILADDIILACGKQALKPNENSSGESVHYVGYEKKPLSVPNVSKAKRHSFNRICLGIAFVVLLILTGILSPLLLEGNSEVPLFPALVTVVEAMELAGAVLCFFGKKPQNETKPHTMPQKQKLGKRTIASAISVFLLIPLTICFGIIFFKDRRYYLISILIILEILIPFFAVFESRKHQSRELVMISVMCALAVGSRMAFLALPQFKPVVAMVIIFGVCFGGETGFLVGAVVGFVSNFYFGQGAWTPWQMFSFGIIGFISGILSYAGLLTKRRLPLCIFGGLATVFLYGGIMNPASLIMMQQQINLPMLVAAYATGLPLDLIHAASTVFFLWLCAEPIIEKSERIKTKYGLGNE